jgi:hypothetical protein
LLVVQSLSVNRKKRKGEFITITIVPFTVTVGVLRDLMTTRTTACSLQGWGAEGTNGKGCAAQGAVGGPEMCTCLTLTADPSALHYSSAVLSDVS